MSLSVASSAAAYGKPLGYGLAGLSTAPAPGGGSPQRPGVAPSWSWTPTSTGSGRRDALMAVLSQIPALDPDVVSGSSQAFGAPLDAASLLVSLNDRPATSKIMAVASASESPQQIDRLQSPNAQATPSDGTIVSPSSASSADQPSADGPAAAAEVKLEALFKTLQAYGL